MGRNPGTVKLSTNYELLVSKPMDARSVVPTKDDLLLFGNNIYKGMVVSIQDSGDVYTLLDPRNAGSSDFSGWKKVGGDGGGSAPDLSDYYTKSEVDEKIPETDHLATKEELSIVEGKIPTDYAKKSDLNNYYDKSTVDQKIADISAGGEIDLEGYAKTEDVDKIADEVELIKKDYTTNAVATQISESVTAGALAGYVKTSDIPGLVSNNIPYDVVAKKDEIADMATKTEVAGTYASKEEVSSTYVTKVAYNEFVGSAATDDEVTSAVNTAKAELGGRIDNLETVSATHITKDVADLTNYYTKTQLTSEAEGGAGLASKSYVKGLFEQYGIDLDDSSTSGGLATVEDVNNAIAQHNSSAMDVVDGKIELAINDAVSSDKVAVLDSSGKIDDEVLPSAVISAITWGDI